MNPRSGPMKSGIYSAEHCSTGPLRTLLRTLFLHHGQVIAFGPTDKVIAEYQRFGASTHLT